MRFLYPALIVSTLAITACANEPKNSITGESFSERIGKSITGGHQQPSNIPRATPEGKDIAKDCEDQRNEYVQKLYLWDSEHGGGLASSYKRMADDFQQLCVNQNQTRARVKDNDAQLTARRQAAHQALVDSIVNNDSLSDAQKASLLRQAGEEQLAAKYDKK